ncbi:MAG: DUF4258 domain-containing protein [Candidatus Nanoarchaeia archaeon]|nr:DUF4258 domain-containing protein [Candidatus Nanoarchaeia archaeon]
MDLETLKAKLRSYPKDKIILNEHSRLRSIQRNISLKDILNHISSPEKLYYFEEQTANKSNEYKFNCFFHHSNKYVYRFVIVINGECVIITVIRINKIMQKEADKV